jgi:uncharacterized protein
MRFEWDEAKNDANKRKHGVSFEAASTVFDDPNEISQEDFDSVDEVRWRTIGLSEIGLHLFVVHTERGMIDNEPVVRIISARRALADERRRYERQATYR